MRRKGSALSDQIQYLAVFPLFKELPVEIRLDIWKSAIPKGRVLRIDIDQKSGNVRTLELVVIPSIFHVCRESREVGTHIYRLGFGEVTTTDDRDWFNPTADTLYILRWLPPVERKMSIAHEFWQDKGRENKMNPLHPAFLSGQYDAPQHKWLARVQHLAVRLPAHYDVDLGNIHLFIRWLAGFQDLISVTFLIDHFPTWHRVGDIVLYEPEDVPMQKFGLVLPSDLEAKLSHSMDDCRNIFLPNWRVPTVELLVMGFKRNDSSFCVRQPDSRDQFDSWGRGSEAL